MSRRSMELLGLVSGTMRNAAEGGRELPLAYGALPGVVCGVAGSFKWKEHPLLGFIAGDTIGANAYRLYRGQGNDRTIALGNVAVTASAVGGSLAWKKHPFWGGVLGFIAGVVATSFVDGSNANRFKQG